ncbi:MAG: FixH family protein [Phycisphaerae bacterium]|nr:FixH family protein [Phycisphaerae bacterium]
MSVKDAANHANHRTESMQQPSHEPVPNAASQVRVASGGMRATPRPEHLGLVASLVRNRWMFVPIGLLALSVTVGLTTVALAVAGHPIGAEPDYYAKAAAWDSHRAQVAVNDKLRWNVAPAIVAGADGNPKLQIEIRDKYAGLIDAESADLEAIPIVSADIREIGPMTRTETGRFERRLQARVAGQWEFRLTIRKGDVTYTDTFRRSLAFTSRKAEPEATQ